MNFRIDLTYVCEKAPFVTSPKFSGGCQRSRG